MFKNISKQSGESWSQSCFLVQNVLYVDVLLFCHESHSVNCHVNIKTARLLAFSEDMNVDYYA